MLGMSGWTGFAPFPLADRAGIFKKNGVEVEIRSIPPVQRLAALAAGALNAAATTVDQHIVVVSAGIPHRGAADRQVERGTGSRCAGTSRRSRSSRARPWRSTVPTVQHFMLSYILEKNGLSIRDVIRQTMACSLQRSRS